MAKSFAVSVYRTVNNKTFVHSIFVNSKIWLHHLCRTFGRCSVASLVAVEQKTVGAKDLISFTVFNNSHNNIINHIT